MKNNLFLYAILIFICIISSISQVLLKMSAKKSYKSIFLQYFNVKVIIAYTLFFAVVIINSILLRYIPFAVASAFAESMPCVLAVINGAIFFNEKITKRTVLGILIIIVGILLIVL